MYISEFSFLRINGMALFGNLLIKPASYICPHCGNIYSVCISDDSASGNVMSCML